jgi:hypothetical protein
MTCSEVVQDSIWEQFILGSGSNDTKVSTFNDINSVYISTYMITVYAG